jgi:hypothetical protein
MTLTGRRLAGATLGVVLCACRDDPAPRPPEPRVRILALLDDLESGGQLPILSSGTFRVGFQRAHDGTAVSADVPLEGHEYLSQGLYLLGAPSSSYCSQATGVALRPVVGDGIRGPALTSAIRGAPASCNFVPVAFVFPRPVRRVQIEHISPAAASYEMTAFDRKGAALVPLPEATGRDRARSMTFETRDACIAWVIFGHQAAVTAVTAIEYERP